MKHLKLLTLVPLALALFLAGCSSDGQGASEKETRKAAAAKEAEDQARIAKWNAYVNLANEKDREIDSLLGVYEHRIGTGEYQIDKKKFNYAKQTTDPKYFVNNIDQAAEYAAKEPKSPLDQSVTELAPAMKNLWLLLHTADDYYSRKAYIDDDFARGAELHKEVLAAREVYLPLKEKFMTALMIREEEQRASELQAMREAGLLIRVAMLEVVMAAQEVQAELAGQDMTSKSLPKLNLEALRPSYDALNKAVTELERVSAKEGQVPREGLREESAQMFVGKANDVRAGVRSMIERAQQGKDGGIGSSIGSPEQFERDLSLLISYYNSAN